MSNTIIAVKLLAPDYSRNYSKLQNIMATSPRVVQLDHTTCLVDSASDEGVVYKVESAEVFGWPAHRCSCKWGQKQGWVADNGVILPCSHILLVSWISLSEIDKLVIGAVEPMLKLFGSRVRVQVVR